MTKYLTTFFFLLNKFLLSYFQLNVIILTRNDSANDANISVGILNFYYCTLWLMNTSMECKVNLTGPIHFTCTNRQWMLNEMKFFFMFFFCLLPLCKMTFKFCKWTNVVTLFWGDHTMISVPELFLAHPSHYNRASNRKATLAIYTQNLIFKSQFFLY